MRWILFATSLVVLAASPPIASAQQLRILSGQAAHERVAKIVSQLAWHTSLAQAEDVARHDNKMVFWIHMLGDIKGET